MSSEQQRIIRQRIVVAVAAWAYELGSEPIMTDADFDSLALEVERDKHIETGKPELDKFFKEEFSAKTGMWVRFHPDMDGLEDIYHRYLKQWKLTPSKN